MSIAAARPAARSLAKPALWLTIAIAGVSVLIFTDLVLIRNTADPYRMIVIADRAILIPHAIAGVVAMLLGPFLFSTRFRTRHFKRHRIMGRVYVGCIALAAPTAALLQFRHPGAPMAFANTIMSAVWFLCTLAAFLTARNRQLVAHRQWMIRSYIFTLNFIITRLPNPIPAYAHMSEGAFALELLMLTCAYLFCSDVYFNWRELTQSRKA